MKRKESKSFSKIEKFEKKKLNEILVYVIENIAAKKKI